MCAAGGAETGTSCGPSLGEVGIDKRKKIGEDERFFVHIV